MHLGGDVIQQDQELQRREAELFELGEMRVRTLEGILQQKDSELMQKTEQLSVSLEQGQQLRDHLEQ